MTKYNDLNVTINQFEQLIKTAPDDKISLLLFVNFLRGFLRTRDRNYSLPSAEIMTIIKQEKPTIFYLLKQQASQNPSLELLTQLSIDYDLAKQRLEELKAKLKG